MTITAIFTTGTLLGSLGLGTGLALALHSVSAGVRSTLLAIFLIPWVIAAVIIGYTWRLIYDPAIGLANSVLGASASARRLADGAEPRARSAVVANVWAGYGIVLLVVSGALANVPPNIILAGQVDGASYRHIVRRVILPAIRPTFLLAALVALRERPQHVRPDLRDDPRRAALPHRDDGARDVPACRVEGQRCAGAREGFAPTAGLRTSELNMLRRLLTRLGPRTKIVVE